MGVHEFRDDTVELEIRHCGLPPVPLQSILLTVFLTLFVSVVAVLSWQGLAPKLSEDWYLRFDWWWRVVVYLMIFVGPAALISMFVVSSAAANFHFVKSVRCSERERAMVIVDATLFGLRKTTTRLDLAQIQEVSAYIGPEQGGNIEFELSVDSLYSFAHAHLRINHVDKREEVIDVLFTIARYCGLLHHWVDANDADLLVVHVVAEPVKGSEPIPAAKGTARYEMDQLASPVETPEVKIGAFDVGKYSDHPIRLETWQSQRMIRFHRPFPRQAAVLLGCLCALGGAVVAYMISTELEDVSGVRWAVVGAAVGFVIPTIYFCVTQPDYEVVLDRTTKRLSWRAGWWRRGAPISEVRSVVLRGNEQYVHRKDKRGYTVYRCQIQLALANGKKVLVIQNKDWGHAADPQRRGLEPLAAAIAKELGVSWSWTGYSPPPVARFIGGAGQTLVLLGLIGLMVFLAWATWTQGQRNAQWQAIIDQLESQGATVTRGGIEIGSVHIFGDGLLVEVNDTGFSDADLQTLTERLKPIPLYGLDLSDTQVTDEGLRNLEGNIDLFLIDLSGTRITAEAPALLAKTNLRSIDLRETPVRLDHLRPFSEFYALNILYLDGDGDTLSDREMTNLMAVPYLDALWVQDEETTSKVVAQLQKQTGRTLETAGEIRFSLD